MTIDKREGRMNYLTVIDKDLSEYLLSNGCKLIEKKVDINEVPVWIFNLGGFNFDINTPLKEGKCCFSEVPKRTFETRYRK